MRACYGCPGLRANRTFGALQGSNWNLNRGRPPSLDRGLAERRLPFSLNVKVREELIAARAELYGCAQTRPPPPSDLERQSASSSPALRTWALPFTQKRPVRVQSPGFSFALRQCPPPIASGDGKNFRRDLFGGPRISPEGDYVGISVEGLAQ